MCFFFLPIFSHTKVQFVLFHLLQILQTPHRIKSSTVRAIITPQEPYFGVVTRRRAFLCKQSHCPPVKPAVLHCPACGCNITSAQRVDQAGRDSSHLASVLCSLGAYTSGSGTMPTEQPGRAPQQCDCLQHRQHFPKSVGLPQGGAGFLPVTQKKPRNLSELQVHNIWKPKLGGVNPVLNTTQTQINAVTILLLLLVA